MGGGGVGRGEVCGVCVVLVCRCVCTVMFPLAE